MLLLSFGIQVQIAEKCEWMWNSLTTYPKIKLEYICIWVQKKWYACGYNFSCIYCCRFYIFSLHHYTGYLEHSKPSIFDAILLLAMFSAFVFFWARANNLLHPKLCTAYVCLMISSFLMIWRAGSEFDCYDYCYIIIMCKQTIGSACARQFSPHRKLIPSTNQSQQRANMHIQNKCFETIKRLPQ